MEPNNIPAPVISNRFGPFQYFQLFFLIVLAGIVVFLTINPPLSDSRLVNEARNGKDTCQKISDTAQRYTCYFELGQAQKDTSFCKNIPIEFAERRGPIGGLNAQCIYAVANARIDANICLESTRELDRYSCLGLIGAAKRDIKICEMIPADFDFKKVNYIDFRANCIENVNSALKR